MADNTAHVPARPDLQPTEDQAAAPTTDTTIPPEATPQRVADGEELTGHTDIEPSAVDVIGRADAPVARLGEDQPAPALVGAVSGGRGDETRFSETTASPFTPRGTTIPKAGGDYPVWSFRDAPGRPEPAAPPPADRHQAELPFPTSTELAAPAPRSQPTFGPVGRSRPAPLVPLLAVLSLGLYAVVWHHRVNRELEEFDPKLHARPLRSTFAVAIPWLVGLLATLAGAAFLVAGRLSVHIPLASQVSTAKALYLLAGLAVVPYLTLLVPFSVVAVVMSLERLRCVEEHVGTTTDCQVRPVGSSLLLAIPVVGGLTLLVREQRRLNTIWGAMAAVERFSR
jgi:hypothetical protein